MYVLIVFKFIEKGFGKFFLNCVKLEADLEKNWMVVVEGI